MASATSGAGKHGSEATAVPFVVHHQAWRPAVSGQPVSRRLNPETSLTSTATTTKAAVAPATSASSSSPWLHFVAGGTGACAGAVVTSPLDVIKTRLQSSLYRVPSKTHQSLVMAALSPLRDTAVILRNVYRTEGFFAWYKGISANLIGVVPSRAINFFVYGNTKHFLASMNNGRESPVVHVFSAAVAGVVTSTITNPIWMVKTRLQLQSNAAVCVGSVRYSGVWDCIRQTVRSEGILGLYRGVTASYLGISESALQWVVYENLKKRLSERRERLEVDAGIVEYRDGKRLKSSRDMIDNFCAAGTAKFVAAAATYPHEVIRTRLRQAPTTSGSMPKYTGLKQCFLLVVREEGPKALYGGLSAHLLRSVPNAAVMFVCYETILHWFSPSATCYAS